MFIWGHPRSQINVVPNPSIASIIGVLLPLIYNPNLCSDESGRRFSEAEVRATAMTADLVGYDPQQAGGVFTFGGTGGIAVRREGRAGKGRCPGWPRRRLKDQARHPGLGAEPLLVLERGQLAGDRPGQRACWCRRTWTTRSSSPALEQAAARGAGRRARRSRPSWPRWARPTPLASTICAAIDALRQRAGRRVLARLPAAHARRRRDRLGLERVQRLRLSGTIRWAFAAARCGRWRPPSTTSSTCRWPIRSASTFTRPATRPTSRRWCCSATAAISS